MDPRMGAFDAVMFDVEDDPVLRSVITVVLELDEEPDEGRLRYRVERLSLMMPKLRQRVVGNSISLAPPRWETDPNFDFDFHLQEVDLPDGTMQDVLDYASTWAERDFDRNRPLWEMVHFVGLEGGRSAVGLKIHHSITDGVGGMQLAALLFDMSADAEDPADLPEAPEGEAAGWRERLSQASKFELNEVAEDLTGAAKAALGATKTAATDPVGSVMATQEFFNSAARVLAPANEPLSPTMVGRSLSQYFGEIEVELSDLKAAGKAAGGGMNDAFVAGVIGGMQRYHQAHGDIPDELRMHMPINTRRADDSGAGNSWIPARFTVPMNELDPRKRIRQIHPVLTQAKNEPALAVSGQVYKLLKTLPRGVTTRIAGGLMKGTDFVATNVPGPPIPVFLAGARVSRFLPFAPKGGAAVNVALMSYNGKAELGINIDEAAVADPAEMMECLRESFAEIIATIN